MKTTFMSVADQEKDIISIRNKAGSNQASKCCPGMVAPKYRFEAFTHSRQLQGTGRGLAAIADFSTTILLGMTAKNVSGLGSLRV
jgi:hypothetical protein